MRKKYSKQYFMVNGTRLSMGEVLAFYECQDLTVEALEALQDGDTIELNDFIPLVTITPYRAL